MARSGKGTRARVLEAASACILQVGARNVALDDIAAHAGVGRQTLYRHFGKRESFFEALLVARFAGVVEAVKALLANSQTFEEAIIAGSIETLRLAAADPVYLSIAEAERALHVDLLMLGKDSALAQQFLEIWRPVFESAREGGVLRAGLTVEQGAEWLRNTHFLLSHRTDLDPAGQAQMLRDFVLPGLMNAQA